MDFARDYFKEANLTFSISIPRIMMRFTRRYHPSLGAAFHAGGMARRFGMARFSVGGSGRLPALPQAPCGVFDQRIDQDGFHLGAVACIRPVMTAAARVLSQLDPVGGVVTTSAEPFLIHEGF